MNRTSHYERAAWALAAVLLAANVYRAAAQSVTVDEAFMYNLFLGGPVADLWKLYDACNHVLYALLAKLSISVLGHSEFALRLPSVLAGALYFYASLRLCRFAFGRGAAFLVSFAVLALNPFVLDYLSAARGYGMALALLLWAIVELVEWQGEDDRRLYRAAIALGLSVAANLVFLIPCVAVAMLAVVRLARRGAREALEKGIDRLAIPSCVTAFLIVALPLSKAERGNFYYGAGTLREMIDSLIGRSLFHAGGFASVRSAVVTAAVLLLPIALSAIIALIAWRSTGENACPTHELLFWCGGAAAIAFFLVLAAHVLLRVPYPLERTGIYFVPLLALALLATGAYARPAARRAVLAAGVFATAAFAAQFNVAYYAEWRIDAGNRQMAQILRRELSGPGGQVRLGADWEFETSLNFYRSIYRLNRLALVDRKDPDGDFDYYVVQAGHAGLVAKRGLRVLYRDAISGTVLAAR